MGGDGFSAELNPPQAEAAAHVVGPLLVFAGAGSGKTRVITYRVANLVACERVPPYRILAVTFTNKAAGEMRARLDGLLGADIARDLWVGTFHAVCAKLLRRYGEAVGVPRNFVIYDSSDQKAVVSRVLTELDLDEKRYAPRAVLARIHKEKQEGRGPEAMVVGSYFDEAIVKAYRRYEDQMKSCNAVDFEDLIWKMVQLLETPNLFEAQSIQRKFDYILVDEFQDTNAIQYRFLRALMHNHDNLCVVGDDDQSIYRWRGADVRNIRGFSVDYPNATVVKLEQNYRSTGHIVSAALGVIAPSKERVPKDLFTKNPNGHPLEVVGAKDEHDEAAYVVRTIQLSRQEGVDPRQMAVFYRVHAQSRVLEEALLAANVPYQIVGGMKFYERAEVKDAVSYLRLLVNPRSDVDLLRIINVPARGIGSTTLDRLGAFASSRKIALFDALSRIDEATEIPAATKKKLGAFRVLFAKIQMEAQSSAPAHVLNFVLDATGYRQTLRAENTAEADARLENLAELAGSIDDYEVEMAAAGEAATLAGYLERVSLQSDVDQMNDHARVTLMTVHSAKGLEFELVILTGMEEEMFPYRGMDPGGEEEMEEERRLAYVAITRARTKLVLTHTETRQIFGTTRWGRPSRFIADLPASAVEHKATRAASSRPERFVDRARMGLGGGAWRHPQAAPSRSAPPRTDGERYVDRDFFADDANGGEGEGSLRRGSRVLHERFGEGEVRNVVNLGEPAVVAFFPGWGEKKVLARFLKVANS